MKKELNPYKLPKSYAEKAKTFRLPAKCTNVLFISDLHIPYHDINAVSIAIEYGKQQNVNCIFINEDWVKFLTHIGLSEPEN